MTANETHEYPLGDIRNYIVNYATVNIFDPQRRADENASAQSSQRAQDSASAQSSTPCSSEEPASNDSPLCQKIDTCKSRDIRNYFISHSDTVNIANSPQRADENALVESSLRQTCDRKQKRHRRMNNFVEHTAFATQGCSNCAGESIRCEKCNANARLRCAECGLPFTRAWHLTRHMRIHTGERPYSCPHAGCSESFKRKDHLANHMRRHTGEMPFLCEHCGRQFRTRQALSMHITSLHSTERKHVCDRCAKTFNRTYNLMKHLRNVHGMKYSCLVCGKSLRTRNDHTNHYVKEHPVLLA